MKINIISTEKYLTYGFKSYKEIYLIKEYLSAKVENLDFQIFYLIPNILFNSKYLFYFHILFLEAMFRINI